MGRKTASPKYFMTTTTKMNMIVFIAWATLAPIATNFSEFDGQVIQALFTPLRPGQLNWLLLVTPLVRG